MAIIIVFDDNGNFTGTILSERRALLLTMKNRGLKLEI
jgi:hypothetical protein